MRNPNKSGWIGVDLDRTLAEYQSGWYDKFGPTHIGKPIPAMVHRVKRWLAEGWRVKIFTARMANLTPHSELQIRTAIEDWCLEHIGQKLEVTCIKDAGMYQIWDDRAVGVVRNTGRIMFPSEVVT